MTNFNLYPAEIINLLAIAAAEAYSVKQKGIVDVFLYKKQDANLEFHRNASALFPCPEGHVLKLQRAIHGLHKASVNFKQDIIT